MLCLKNHYCPHRETTTATTSSFHSGETISTSATLTTVSSEVTSTTATLSTLSSETATISTSSSETETNSATVTTFSSTESASTTASATTTSSVAPDPDCYKYIKILRGQSIGGVNFYADSMTLEQCMDVCAGAGNCIAFDFMPGGGSCYISYTGEEGNLWGPLGDDMYIGGYTNTC